MRHLLVALFSLLTLAVAGPSIAAAQEATPEAGTTATQVIRTDIRYFLPAGPDEVHPGLTVAATVEGVCGFSSIVALDRQMPGTASVPTMRSSTPASSP